MKLNFLNFIFLFLFTLVLQAGVLPPQKLEPDQTYLTRFIEDEQLRNDRVENTDVFSSITRGIQLDFQFRPENQTAFNLPVYLIPAEKVIIYQTNPATDELIQDSASKKIRFFVHPASVQAFSPYLKQARLESNWKATPTSSYRTLLTWPAEDPAKKSTIYSLKVSLDSEIGEVSRMLSRGQIERATAVSYLLKNTQQAEFSRNGIYFIDEPASVFFKEFQFGYSVRQMPALPETSRLIPLFSLYSKANGKSELQTLIEQSGQSAKEFVLLKLIKPIVEQTFYLAFEHGLIGVPHEQNILVRMDQGQLTSMFYYRDLGSFHINRNLRDLKGLNSDFVPESFLEKNKPSTKLELIENIQDYLLNAQFYALKRALRSSSLSDTWIQNEVFALVQQQIYKYTDARVNSWTAAKAAVTRRANLGGHQHTCRALF